MRALVFLALASGFGLLALVQPAAGAKDATSCRQQVIDDWSDNGRVDRVYRLDCYQAAIGSLPPDIRDYTDAHDSIERALTLAVRAKGGSPPASPSRALATAPPVATSSSAAFPPPLIALGGLGAATLAAGALGYASRRAARRHGGSAR